MMSIIRFQKLLLVFQKVSVSNALGVFKIGKGNSSRFAKSKFAPHRSRHSFTDREIALQHLSEHRSFQPASLKSAKKRSTKSEEEKEPRKTIR